MYHYRIPCFIIGVFLFWSIATGISLLLSLGLFFWPTAKMNPQETSIEYGNGSSTGSVVKPSTKTKVKKEKLSGKIKEEKPEPETENSVATGSSAIGTELDTKSKTGITSDSGIADDTVIVKKEPLEDSEILKGLDESVDVTSSSH
ncbi:unnamed protein product [Ambrosiozyma monospora]|uniref:Unnamed protein product n=1 Tax=Ambrosiozyma monospora TaxID=43982 RepID=A0A9W7DJD7_AMBMO|nr:unnamed protein product [Ambrosiozyma monospora]